MPCCVLSAYLSRHGYGKHKLTRMKERTEALEARVGMLSRCRTFFISLRCLFLLEQENTLSLVPIDTLRAMRWGWNWLRWRRSFCTWGRELLTTFYFVCLVSRWMISCGKWFLALYLYNEHEWYGLISQPSSSWHSELESRRLSPDVLSL